MNYLGHIYFSGSDIELMYANLFGDSVKGSNFSQFPITIQEGIRLHRAIDHFIDTHHEVRKVRQQLQGELPKISAIAIDLFFDHLLAKHWPQYHPQELDVFLENFYMHEPHYFPHYSSAFQDFIVQLSTKKWISYYATFYGLQKSCEGVGKRISFPNTLHKAPNVFLQMEEPITEAFHLFMADATQRFLPTIV
jgi:acyl carrier protein phosphodiesterase